MGDTPERQTINSAYITGFRGVNGLLLRPRRRSLDSDVLHQALRNQQGTGLGAQNRRRQSLQLADEWTEPIIQITRLDDGIRYPYNGRVHAHDDDSGPEQAAHCFKPRLG